MSYLHFSGTKVCEKVRDLITSRQMTKDVPKLSRGPQTAALEGFHAVNNHFAPKMIGFSYHGMLNRLVVKSFKRGAGGAKFCRTYYQHKNIHLKLSVFD